VDPRNQAKIAAPERFGGAYIAGRLPEPRNPRERVSTLNAISADSLLGMPDVLIRDVPPEDLARIDANAARLGLSRTEYLRRRLHQDATRPATPVTVADLEAFAARFGDLSDPEVMRQAWS
jgi:hypothetical protein